MKDDRPIHLKFGYDHMVEMASIRAELMAQGQQGMALHFNAIRAYEARHVGDPTYAEKCAARRRLDMHNPDRFDPLRVALELIRDGHNDPRGLARETLLLMDSPQ